MTPADLNALADRIVNAEHSWLPISGTVKNITFTSAECDGIYHALRLAASQQSPASGDNWRDDPSADERWNAGLDFGMKHFCEALGLDPKDVNWDAATETVEGDVSAVIGNMLRAKFGENFDPDAVSASGAEVFIQPMHLADDHTDYFVTIKVGDKEVTPHVFREEYKAAYHVALYDWLLNGNGEDPDIVAFGPDDFPAQVTRPASGAEQMREALQLCYKLAYNFSDCTTAEIVEARSAIVSALALPLPSSPAPGLDREALELLAYQQRGRARALRILDSHREKSDLETLTKAEAYEECGNELKAILALQPAPKGENCNYLSFFSENVDSWGALEWFNRLVKAVKERDAAVIAKDDVAFEICDNVAASSATRLAREFEGVVHSALSLPPQHSDVREALKVALCVLCSARDGQSWSANSLKDFDIAIKGIRVALTATNETDGGKR